jgi:protein-disulfide isomerase
MIALAFAAWMAVAPLNPDEVLATVNGVAITRRDLQAALPAKERRVYDDAVSDLRDVQHSAVRDYLGRQAIAAQAKQQNTTPDAIYDRELATDYEKLDANLRNRIEQERERIYNEERAALDDVIQKRALEAAARAKGMTVEQFTQSIESDVAPVTKADIDFIIAYENSKQKAAELPPGPQRLEAAIRAARVAQKRDAAVAAARSTASVNVNIEPPRVNVSTANAPVAGSPDAKVKLLVFTDFECPYCKESEPVLARLARQYGDRLAVFYRNYPLPNHLYAQPAAAAAICAAEQGKYFEMHDMLFAHQNDLAHPDYAAWAEDAGLDPAKFDQCRASSAPAKVINADIRDAVAAGVSGTPAFFVNGRLVRDLDHLAAVVAEEAAR